MCNYTVNKLQSLADVELIQDIIKTVEMSSNSVNLLFAILTLNTLNSMVYSEGVKAQLTFVLIFSILWFFTGG